MGGEGLEPPKAEGRHVYSVLRLTASLTARNRIQSHLPGLNRGPTVYKTVALPTELRWQYYDILVFLTLLVNVCYNIFINLIKV